jgi:hypothetical protein
MVYILYCTCITDVQGVYKGCVKGLIVYEFTLTWADVMSPASTPARMVSGGVSEA